MSWKGAGPQFRVIGLTNASDETGGQVLTPEPISASEFTQPVELGRERCFAVRSVTVTGGATLEGPASATRCITLADTYPPPAPTNLQAIQEGNAVTLTWTGVEAADLGGYVVLRGDGAGESMQPLMREPIRETTFKDASVQPGATYTYSVYAVDSVPTPNVSQQSNRQAITVR